MFCGRKGERNKRRRKKQEGKRKERNTKRKKKIAFFVRSPQLGMGIQRVFDPLAARSAIVQTRAKSGTLALLARLRIRG